MNWFVTSKFCFNDKNNPDDEVLGEQIVKVIIKNVLINWNCLMIDKNA